MAIRSYSWVRPRRRSSADDARPAGVDRLLDRHTDAEEVTMAGTLQAMLGAALGIVDYSPAPRRLAWRPASAFASAGGVVLTHWDQ